MGRPGGGRGVTPVTFSRPGDAAPDTRGIGGSPSPGRRWLPVMPDQRSKRGRDAETGGVANPGRVPSSRLPASTSPPPTGRPRRATATTRLRRSESRKPQTTNEAPVGAPVASHGLCVSSRLRYLPARRSSIAARRASSAAILASRLSICVCSSWIAFTIGAMRSVWRSASVRSLSPPMARTL